jgi:hypothetical protein
MSRIGFSVVLMGWGRREARGALFYTSPGGGGKQARLVGSSYFPTVWGAGNPTYLPEVFSIHVSVRKVVPTLTIKKR